MDQLPVLFRYTAVKLFIGAKQTEHTETVLNMTSRRLESDSTYRSLGQRLARQIHLYKAKFKGKERPRLKWLSQFIPSALCDENGAEELVIPVKEQGKIGPGLAHFGSETHRDFIVQAVETVRLDDFIKDAEITKVDFIKIDVEGAELLALKGGASTIEQHKPVIFAEICDDFTQRMGYAPKELFTFLEKSGYSANLVNEENLTLFPVANYQSCGDYLFIHESKHVT